MADVVVVTHRPPNMNGLIIVTEEGATHRLPTSPSKWKFKDQHRWGVVEREGLKPIARRRGSGARTLEFSILVAALDYTVSVEDRLQDITGWASRGNVFRIKNGSSTYMGSCWWYVKDMDLDVQRVTPEGEPTQAVLSFSLEEYTPSVYAVIKPPPPPPPPPPPIQSPAPNATPVKQPIYRYHKTVQGDTLSRLAYRYLGSCYKWREIYELNKAAIGANPNQLPVGITLQIPPR